MIHLPCALVPDRVPYGHGAQGDTVDGEPVVAFGTFPAYSAIFFFRGRELADDGNDLLEGGGKQLRFVRLRTAADAARPAIRRLVQAAIRLARSPGSR